MRNRFHRCFFIVWLPVGISAMGALKSDGFVFDGPQVRKPNVPSRRDREDQWRKLGQAGNSLLRRESERSGLAVNQIDYLLVAAGSGETPSEGWVLGATTDADVSLIRTSIDLSGRPAHSAAEFRGFLYVSAPGITQVTAVSSGPFEVLFDERAALPPVAGATESVSIVCFDLPVGHHTLQVRWENHWANGHLRLSFGSGEDAQAVFRMSDEPADVEAARQRLEGAVSGVSPWLRETIAGAHDVRKGIAPGMTGATVDGWFGEKGGWLILSNRSPGEYPTFLPSVFFTIPVGTTGDRISFPAVSRWSSSGEGFRIFPVNLDLGGLRLLWSTAEPIGVFKNRGKTYLLSRSHEGKEVEYGFAQAAISEFQLSPDMKRFDVAPDRVAIKVAAGGNRSLKILPKDGAPVAVMTVGVSTSKKAEVWEVSGDSWAVIYDGERISSTGDVVRIRVRGEPFLDLRAFPQGGILSLECDGDESLPVRGGDYDVFRLKLRLPPMYSRLSSDKTFSVSGAFNGSDLEDLLCRIVLEGSEGVLRSGDTVVAAIPEPEQPFEVSLLNHLRDGRRSFTIDFRGPTGRIKSVRLVPILVKDISLHKEPE